MVKQAFEQLDADRKDRDGTARTGVAVGEFRVGAYGNITSKSPERGQIRKRSRMLTEIAKARNKAIAETPDAIEVTFKLS